ncbi:MAG: response regulator [Negativicutes bacterium]|nr:response regulator [Negativicutes bacterium]
MKVLIVDDSDFTRRILASILRELGIFHIDEAVNGIDAVKQIDKTSYDLITVDLVMPNSSGIDVIAHIKKTRPQASIIVCSSVNAKETVMQIVKLGVDDFILKPFNENKVKDVLSRRISQLKAN